METQQPDYISIGQEYRTEYVIEKSRFIATIAPCQTETQAQDFINRIKKEFWDARHNCTAFALGARQEQQRSSDDGEPSGTAGKPILEVLKKTGLTNVAIVVTRYFGGIKLGAGGLIRAYSHTAALAVKGAAKELHTSRRLLEVSLDYSQFGAMERFLQDQGYYYESSFGATVDLTIYVAPQEVEDLTESLTNATGGRASIQEGPMKKVRLPYEEGPSLAQD